MKKIIFVILICKNVLANDEKSNEKYIDLLPDEEKQEFLNKIARRILEGIKSDDTPNESHVDITDDQLDAHDAFVQEILKEETNNLKNKRRGDGDEINRSSASEKNNNEKRDEADLNTDDKEDHIDLTLREGKRYKRKNYESRQTIGTTEMFYDVIPVQTIFDRFENDDVNVNNDPEIKSLKENNFSEVEQERNITNKNKEILTSLEKGQEDANDKSTVNFDNDLFNSANLTLHNNTLQYSLVNESNEKDNLRKSFHNNLKLGTTEMGEFDPNSNSNENSTMADYNISDEQTTHSKGIIYEKVTSSTMNDGDTWVSTQKIYIDSEEKDEGNKDESTTLHYNNTHSNNITDSVKNTFGSDSVNISKIIKNDTIAIGNATYTDSHKSKGKFLRSFPETMETQDMISEDEKLSVKSTLKTTKGNLSSKVRNTSSSLPVSKVTNNLQLTNTASVKSEPDTENEDIEVLSMPEKITMSTPIAPIDIKNTKRGFTSKDEPIEKNRTESLNEKPVLRLRLDNQDMSEIDESESTQNAVSDDNTLKIYEVLELDPSLPQFKTSGKILQKQHPVYVPVYNYAPDNAYFTPYNKFGPNEENNIDINEDNTKNIDVQNLNKINLNEYARKRFSGYAKKKENYVNNAKYPKISYLQHSNEKQKQYGKVWYSKIPYTYSLVNQEIYYNPDDYADLDYFSGRSMRRKKKLRNFNTNINDDNQHFPDSNEREHALSIHKSNNIKDHVRAVRNMLYIQKLFGYVPQVNERAIRKTYKDLRIRKNLNGTVTPYISKDYYYDRASSEDNTENKLFRSIIKQNSNTNFSPLTPNPLNFESDLEYRNLEKDDKDLMITDISKIPFKKVFNSMLVVLKDSIKNNNELLMNYDWLKSTVNIQAALRKLVELIEKLNHAEYVHPKDKELLKYTLYLFKVTKTTMKEEAANINVDINDEKVTQRKKSVIKFPKFKVKNKIKDPIKLWKNYVTFLRREEDSSNIVREFKALLLSLLFHLNDFHNAIKHISVVTEYKTQNWLKDLKNIYLDKGGEKSLAELILHLSLSRLLDSIEDSSPLVERSFRNFVEKNRSIVEKDEEECVFILNVLKELKN